MDDNYNNYNINNPGNNQQEGWRMAEDNRQVYPTPQLNEKHSKKKKGKFGKFMLFMAAALAFGIIAGIGASGYHYFFHGRQGKGID
jgi:hypothetical protein